MVDRVEQLKDIQDKALELFIRKNADYGDAFAKFGLIGVLMRIEDNRCSLHYLDNYQCNHILLTTHQLL